MFFSNFQVDFINLVSVSGYTWQGNSVVPNKDAEYREVLYSPETFKDFIALKDFYTDTDKMKLESLKFFSNWGLLGRHGGDEYLAIMNAIHRYESFRFDLRAIEESGVLPDERLPVWPMQLNVSYQWNQDGSKLLPTVKPHTLDEAITFTIAMSGPEANSNNRKCLYFKEIGPRDTCEKFITGRSDKRFCNDLCKSAYHHHQKAKNQKE